MKQAQAGQAKNTPISDKEIARRLKCSPKQFQKRWYQILEIASKVRNEAAKV
jgi:AraC-like DNA-binding protein